MIERFGKFGEFVISRDLHPRIPIAIRNLLGCACQLFDGTRDASRSPAAEKNRQQDSAAAHQQCGCADMAFQLNIGSPRVAYEQNSQQRLWTRIARTV